MQIAAVETEVVAIRARLASDPNRGLVLQLQHSLTDAQDSLKRLQVATLDLDERISQLESEASPLRERIRALSNHSVATSYRDEEAKEHQSSVSKARLEELEEEELVLMESLEETRIYADEQEAVVRDLAATADAAKLKWIEVEATYLGELETKESELKALIHRLSDADRSFYESLRGRLEGTVLAVVHDQVCGYCGVKVSTRTYSRLRSQSSASLGERDRCEECDRFLILPG